MRKIIALLSCLLLLVPAVAAQDACNLPPRLLAGQAGRVLFTDGSPLNLRTQAGRGNDVVATLVEGTRFSVVEGPTCADGIQWWHIEAGDKSGWAAEGTVEGYFIEPMTVNQMEASAALEDRLAADSDTTLVMLDQSGDLHLTNLQFDILESIPGVRGISIYGARISYGQGDGSYVRLSNGDTTQVIAPDIPGTLRGMSVSANGAQVAWLYDVTVVEPTMMDDCRPEDGCLGKVYDLYVSDVNGENLHAIWHGSTGDLTPLTLERWRLDGGAVYLQTVPVGVASPNYPETGGFIEILTDGSTPEYSDLGLAGLRIEQGYVPVMAFSDDGQWQVIYDSGVFVVSADGARYAVSRGVIQEQWTFSPDNHWLTWSDVVYGDGLDLDAVQYFRMNLTNGDTGIFYSFRDNLPGSIETGEIGDGLPYTDGWLADDLLLVTQRSHEYVFDVETGGSTSLSLPEAMYLMGVI